MNPESKTSPRRKWAVWWGLMAVLAAGFAITAVVPFLQGPAASQIPMRPEVAHYISLIIHGVPGALALLLGPFQFVTRLRVRFPRAHRISGQIYMVAVLVGAFAAMAAAAYSISGFPAQVAFSIISVAWLYTLFRAYQTIRRGEVQLHRIWMIRNYSLTFAAVMLRVYLLSLGALQKSIFPSLTFEDIYVVSLWSSFLINVLVAEYFIVNRTLQPLARRRQRLDAGITQADRDDTVGAAH